MNKRLGALLLALPFSAGAGTMGSVRALAADQASPDLYLYGSDGVGAIALDGGDCVSVRETLTFDLRDLPEEGEYGRAEANYLFSNAGEQDAEVTLLLPFGKAPAYSVGEQRYTVWVNGEEVACRPRYTYAGSYGFSIDNDLPLLCEEYKENCFFEADMLVTEYTFQVDEASGNDFGLDFEYDCSPKETRIAASECAYFSIKNGKGKVWIPLRSGMNSVSIYAFGAPLKESACSLCTGGKAVRTAAVPLASQVSATSFFEFSMRNYTDLCGVSQTDWYNGFVDMLNAYTDGATVTVIPSRYDKSCLMKWYEYTVSVPAGGSVTNKVSMPLRPSVSMRGGKRYEYEYLLSAAREWREYEGIEIRILTDYDLAVSSLEFTQTDWGYVFSRDSLPQGELVFTVTEEPFTAPYTPYGPMTPALTTALVMLGVIVLVGAAVGIALAVRSGRKRKSAAHAGEVVEGRIDLDAGFDSHGSNENGSK
ncbi:MAG: hypothetical protein K2H43_02430 [Clostridia bacterium]|nr:hypothetical protein [Clostridia bacterium]